MTGPVRVPLAWRVPPWQPALLYLIAAGCAAANVYADPSPLVRVATVAIGTPALVMAIFATRMYLVVDEDGVGIRRLLRERSLDWDDIADVAVVERSFDVMTLRVSCHDGRYLDVPQSLVLPSRPTGKPRVRARLGDIARQVKTYGEQCRR